VFVQEDGMQLVELGFGGGELDFQGGQALLQGLDGFLQRLRSEERR